MKRFEAEVGDKVIFNGEDYILTKGKEYTVVDIDDDGDIYVINDGGIRVNRYAKYFDLVTPKKVWYNGKHYTVIGEFNFDSEKLATGITNNLWNIAKFFEDGHRKYYILDQCYYDTLMIPVDLCSKEAPKKTIKLTDEYDAVIEKDFVTVGCQKIPISKVQEIINEHGKL